MSENTIPIPARLKNVSEGGHVAGAADIIDDVKNKTQDAINVEVDNTLTLHQSEINALDSQNYVTVDTYSDLPATGSVDTVYRVCNWDGSANSGAGAVDATVYSEYAWDDTGSEYKLLDVKTAIGEVFDISLYNAVGGVLATYADLSAALGVDGANVPSGVRKGGMSVKYVMSSDNNYVQYFLTKDEWSASEADWEKVNLEEEVSRLDHEMTTVAQIKDNYDEGSNVDFTISDKNNYNIVEFSDGQIKTKHFDSTTAIHQGDTEIVDLSIQDEYGYDVVEFLNGHIKTKNFDSSNISDSIRNFINTIFAYHNPFGNESRLLYKDGAMREFAQNCIPLIFICGQSNADGRVPYTDAPQWLVDGGYGVPNYYMWDANNNEFSLYNVRTNNGANAGAGNDGSGEDKFSFDPFFAKLFIENNDTPLYAIRQTLGGIGIAPQPTTGTRPYTWQPIIKNIVSGCNSMCLSLLNKYNNALAWASKNGVKLIPVAILWHQGEADTETMEYVNAYQQNLANVISWIRGIIGATTIPFINAFVSNADVRLQAINQAFVNLNTMDEFMKTVDMQGHYDFLSDGVGLHFNASAIEYMGEQMYQKYELLNI